MTRRPYRGRHRAGADWFFDMFPATGGQVGAHHNSTAPRRQVAAARMAAGRKATWELTLATCGHVVSRAVRYQQPGKLVAPPPEYVICHPCGKA